jgi:hypothetical protein
MSTHYHFYEGDWRESYAKVLRLLHAISHFNPGTKCVIDTCGQWLPNDNSQYYPVLKHVFWCFSQCATGWEVQRYIDGYRWHFPDWEVQRYIDDCHWHNYKKSPPAACICDGRG